MHPSTQEWSKSITPLAPTSASTRILAPQACGSPCKIDWRSMLQCWQHPSFPLTSSDSYAVSAVCNSSPLLQLPAAKLALKLQARVFSKGRSVPRCSSGSSADWGAQMGTRSAYLTTSVLPPPTWRPLSAVMAWTQWELQVSDGH